MIKRLKIKEAIGAYNFLKKDNEPKMTQQILAELLSNIQKNPANLGDEISRLGNGKAVTIGQQLSKWNTGKEMEKVTTEDIGNICKYLQCAPNFLLGYVPTSIDKSKVDRVFASIEKSIDEAKEALSSKEK